jgi:hypothetical protein
MGRENSNSRGIAATEVVRFAYSSYIQRAAFFFSFFFATCATFCSKTRSVEQKGAKDAKDMGRMGRWRG